MTIDHRTKYHELKGSPATSGPGRTDITAIANPLALDVAMDLTGTTNAELARATGWSESYVLKVRNGIFRRASRVFLARAAEHLSVKWGNPTVLVTALTKGGDR